MSNQTLIGMAIIAAILIGFYAPSTYFDHKVNACMNAYEQQSTENKSKFYTTTTKIVCVAQVNGG